jgi:hypothetical protein
MAEARCPVCGRVFNVPEGPGRAMIEAKFLRHKDGCRVPEVDKFVRVTSYVALVEEVDVASEEYPLLTVRYPSGRASVVRAAVVYCIEDQEAARERFFG